MLIIEAIKLAAESNRIILLSSDTNKVVVLVHPKQPRKFAGFTPDVIPAFNDYHPQSFKEYPFLDEIGTKCHALAYDADDYTEVNSWEYTGA